MATHSVIGLLLLLVPVNPCHITFSKPAAVQEGNTIRLSCSTDTSCRSYLKIESVPPSGLETSQSSVRNTATADFRASWSDDSREFSCQTRGNKDPQLVKKISISVRYGPKEVRVQADPGLIVTENMTLRLLCSAHSDPPVSSVTWSRVTPGQEQHVHTGADYTVKSVSVNHSGHYSCTAHNSIGQGTSPPAQVQVQFGPNVVVLRAEEEQGSDGSRSVTLSCSSHSFPPVSNYTWYRSTEGGVTKVSENNNYTVLSTQPGVYYCTAKNEVSESTSEPVSLFLPENYLKFISPALKLVLIVLLPVFIYRLARDLQNKSEPQESTSDRCMIGGRNRSSRRKPNQRQGLNPEDSFCEETQDYDDIEETCPQLTDRREEQVNIDVGQAQVTFRITAPEEAEQ